MHISLKEDELVLSVSPVVEKLNAREGVFGHGRRILVPLTAEEFGLLGFKLVPLFAGYLAGTATGAFGHIDEKCGVLGKILRGCSYLCTSLLDITHKRLVLRNVGIGIPDRIGQDIGAVARGQADETEVPGDCNLFHHFPTNCAAV